MVNGTMILERAMGEESIPNIDKIHFVVEEACSGLAGVSRSPD